MDLWIRSQDKERLIKPVDFYIEETIDYVNKSSEFNIYALTKDDIIIGTYKTKERALEVLDEIQETICLDEFNYENEEKTVYQDCYRYKSNIIAVYEMPEE